MIKNFVATLAIFGAGAALLAGGVNAVAEIVVTQDNPQGWSTAFTNEGGDVSFITDATAPYGTGALRLTTDETNAARAQYMHAGSGKLADVHTLSYRTRQVEGPPHAAASYQLVVDLNGAAEEGYSVLVYEPYWNGTVIPGTWQSWDVDAGNFWSSRDFSEGTCVVAAGGGGAPFYSLTALKTMCPDAVVTGYGVNIGTYNPGYDVLVDGFEYNNSLYNFEYEASAPTPTPTPEPKAHDVCKDKAWKNLRDGQGETFRNQGRCVKYYNHMDKNMLEV